MRKGTLSKKLKKISVVKVFAISYLIIFTVSIVVNICIYANIDRKVFKQINDYNESILKSRVVNTDKLMSDISVNATKISLLKDINSAVTYNKNYTSADVLSMIKTMETIGYQLSEQVESNIIFCHNSELVLSPGSVHNAEKYYNAYFSKYFDKYEDWKEFFVDAPSGTLLKLNADNQKDNAIIYVYQFDAIGRSDCRGTVITQLNNSLLFSGEDMIECFENGDGELIASNVDMTDIDRNSDKYMRFEFKSQYLDLNYVYLIPKKAFYSAFKNIRLVATVGNVVYVLITVMIIWYFISLQSSSVKKVMRTIRKNVDIKQINNQNEYEIIDKSIKLLTKKYEESVSRSMMEKRRLGSSLMADFVTDEYYGMTSIEEHFKSFGIFFTKKLFYVAGFYFDNLSELFFEKNNGDKYENYELSKFILQNVFEDIVPKNVNSLFFETNRILMCVLNMDSDDDLPEELLNELNTILANKFNIHFKTALSQACQNINELPLAYREAIRAAQDRYISDENILRPDKRKFDNHNYVYTFEREQQLTNYIRSGNGDGAKQLIKDILIDCYKKGKYSETMIECVISDVYATFMKLLDVTKHPVETDKIIKRIRYVGTYAMDDIFDEISQFIDQMIEATDIKEIPKKNIAQRADEVVLREYRNVNLNVNYIAEKLDVRANYLSAKYKAIRGVALLDHINMMRVERAKEIIDNSDDNLEKISEMVGFASIRTFSRAFSKFVGTTPGEYRNKKV